MVNLFVFPPGTREVEHICIVERMRGITWDYPISVPLPNSVQGMLSCIELQHDDGCFQCGLDREAQTDKFGVGWVDNNRNEGDNLAQDALLTFILENERQRKVWKPIPICSNERYSDYKQAPKQSVV